jgi:hemerythrin superfamily protein
MANFSRGMDAIALLRGQHREVERLFEEAGQGADPGELFDALAVHAALEERQFYPATRALRSGDQLRETEEEHLAIKQLVADLLGCDRADAQFEARLNLLAEQVSQHVAEEEASLFPAAERSLSPEEREELGASMQELAEELREPRAAQPADAHAVD